MRNPEILQQVINMLKEQRKEMRKLGQKNTWAYDDLACQISIIRGQMAHAVKYMNKDV